MQKEQIKYWHSSALPNVELSIATFNKFEFERHVHLDYHIGVVSYGSQEYIHKGRSYKLYPESISTLNPDEIHNGKSINDSGYQAHVMSIPIKYMTQINKELTKKESFFGSPLINEPSLYYAFLALHQLLVTKPNCITNLQIETTMMAFVTELFLHNDSNVVQIDSKRVCLTDSQLGQIKELFHDDISQSFQLNSLASSLNMSKFQFLRRFNKSVGMPPHAYLKRIRLEYAKKELLKGNKIAEIANQVGFFDQSHFNNAFKSAFLITPANFQRLMQ
ncbi:MAG: AraC family transcriptional regulator [Colwellia sp.]